jgi:nucleotide-binding universal stress UspA family protein
MSMRSILVPWWGGSTSTAQLDAAFHVARCVEAHVEVVFIRPTLDDLTTTMSSAVSPPATLLRDMEPGLHEAGKVAQASFAVWREANDVSDHIINGQLRVPFAAWSERNGLPEQLILRRGRMVDMTVLRFPKLADALDRPHNAALFETGHPVLFVPDHVGRTPLFHVVVAWNGSLHSTRAVIGAMALLRAAERVTVLTTTDLSEQRGNQDANGDMNLADALAWHGVETGHRQLESATLSPGGALLQAADELKATLLVMGATTRSRMPAGSLGRATEYVLPSQPRKPVRSTHFHGLHAGWRLRHGDDRRCPPRLPARRGRQRRIARPPAVRRIDRVALAVDR